MVGDGVNSALRTAHADHFGAEIKEGRNRYIWLGTGKVFDSFTFAFVETDHGWIWCYGYAFDPGHSTVVVECAPETWTGLGLDRADEAEGLGLLEKLFADILDGHPLIGRSAGFRPRPVADLPHPHQPDLAPRQPGPPRRRRPHHPLLHRRRRPPSPWRTPSPWPRPCASTPTCPGPSPATSGSAPGNCSPSRARPVTAPSGTRT